MNLRDILAAGAAAGAIAFAAAPSAVLAQPTTTNGPEDDTAVAPEETIIVTGTRSTTRTVENSPVPVDVLSGEMLTESGLTETNRILNKLVPSFNFPQPAISDGSDAVRPATLRGLGPDQTLVLLNGKRRHTAALLNINGTVGRGSAAVDMNSIPALAIERIEVLRDGASSQYGSDAIAGVINVRLKTADSGGRATATYGKYVTTLNDVLRVTGLQTNAAGQPMLDPADATGAGTTGSRYFLANTDGELEVRDGETYSVASNIGLPFFGTEGGYLNLTAEYRHRGRTNRTGFDLRPNYVTQAGMFDPRELTFDRREFRFGDPTAEDYTLFLNAAFPLTDVWEVYTFATFNQRDSVSAANYRGQNNANNVDYSQLAPNQAPPATFTRPVLTPNGFLPFIESDYTDYAYTAGLRGEVLGGWRTDFSVGIGSNDFDYIASNTVNASFGAATQRRFDAGGLKYSQGLATLDLSRGRRRVPQRALSNPAGRCSVVCARAVLPRACKPVVHPMQRTAGGRRPDHRPVHVPRTPGRSGLTGLPGSPGQRRDRCGTAQHRRLCRTRHRRDGRPVAHCRRPLRALLRFRQHGERQDRRAL
jgi:iron complex outermembrane receptor protein